MNWKVITATCAVAVLVLGAGAEAKDKGRGAAKDNSQPSASVGHSGAPETISGQVVKIDENNGMVTVRGSDGTTHEFKANKETLKDLEVGDTLEAKRRN